MDGLGEQLGGKIDQSRMESELAEIKAKVAAIQRLSSPSESSTTKINV